MTGRVTDGAVFDAVLDLLAERGYDRTTTRAIGEAAGVNESTLFRRFTSKANLVEQAVRSRPTPAPDRLLPTGDVAADLLLVLRHCRSRHEPGSSTMDLDVLRQADEVIRHHQRRGALVAESPGDALFALAGPVIMRAFAEPVTDLEAWVHRFLHGHRVAPDIP
ncbi:helix-turn-helix domain-containing protein [Lentzea sp. NPDC058436]|uniref:TetR/AcrR family transcriptional regulator n=1 Tax=Lentzea sp. NPDC058436 TaxID=3346499 RepID=UPI00364924B0